MPLTLPNLDDRRFDDLVAAGKRLIPGLAPSWTDHNPSDPGITLIELFAYIAELLMYRADRVSEANRQAFVRLLRGDPAWQPTKAIDEEIRDAVLEFRREKRAVTAADFRALAEAYVPHPISGTPEVRPVARARCLPGCDADASPRNFVAPAHVSVLIVPRTPADRQVPATDLIAALAAYLTPRCLLTTRLHVAGPRYLKVRVRLTATVFADQNEATARGRIEQRLVDFFHPLRGGTDGQGWPFGGAVYRSALYAVLDAIDGVDFAAPTAGQAELSVLTSGAGNRAIEEAIVAATAGGSTHLPVFTGIRLEPDELVELAPFPLPGEVLNDGHSWIEVQRLVAILPEE